MASRAVVMAKPRLCSLQAQSVGAITIDACLDETHTLNNTVTDHPVEEGFNISDHVRPEADQVQLRCFISNTPLSEEQQTRTIQEGAVQFQTTAQQGVQIGAVDGRGAEVFKKLKKLRDEGMLLKVVTTLKTYPEKDSTKEGMVIQSLTIPRTSKNYDGIEFTVQLKQIRIVTNQSTRDIKPKDVRTTPKKDQGSKTATEEKPESTASKLRDSAVSLYHRVTGTPQ